MKRNQIRIEGNHQVKISQNISLSVSLEKILEPQVELPEDQDDLPTKDVQLVDDANGRVTSSITGEGSEDGCPKSGPTFLVIDENLSSNSSWGSVSGSAPMVEFPSDDSYECVPTLGEQRVSSH